ncbi:hypothetical protein ACOSQ3_017492 [Xanthoceras sorbifolium]
MLPDMSVSQHSASHKVPSHPMINRSNTAHQLPKVYSSLCQASVLIAKVEPKSVKEALQQPHWFTTMKEEYQALINNHIWSPVPVDASMNLVTCNQLLVFSYVNPNISLFVTQD